MIRMLHLILVFMCLSACAQTPKPTIMTTLIKHSPQDMLNLHQTVTHHKNEPHYGMYIHASNTNFEVRVNDRIVFMNYDMITNGFAIPGAYFPINTKITNAGLQTIEVRMYPCWNRQTEQLEPQLKNARVKLDIVERSYNPKKDDWTGEEYVYSWEAPTAAPEENDPMAYFLYPKRLEYIYKDTFLATVPYAINTLDNAINLYTTDSLKIKQLIAGLLPYYEKFKDIYQENNLDAYATLVYEKEKRLAQQFFFDAADSEKRWEKQLLEKNGRLVENGYKMQAMEHYKLRFYGNGKLVTLVSTNLKKQGINKSALHAVGKRTTRIHALFYKPKGSKEYLLY